MGENREITQQKLKKKETDDRTQKTPPFGEQVMAEPGGSQNILWYFRNSARPGFSGGGVNR